MKTESIGIVAQGEGGGGGGGGGGGAMEFKPPESCCHSNYRYLHQGLLSICYLFLYSHFFPKIEVL